MQRVEVVLGILVRDNEVLVCRRHDTGPFPGLWEFPGGKREENETIHQTLARELREELGVEVRVTGILDGLDFDYPTIQVRLTPLLCVVEAGDPQPLASQEVKWMPYDRLGELGFPAANASLVEQIEARFRRASREA
jgi:A/G-specific adenine glycosylase